MPKRGRKSKLLEFDLLTIREIKRRAKRVVRDLEAVERWMVKVRKSQRPPNADEIEATKRLYSIGRRDDV